MLNRKESTAQESRDARALRRRWIRLISADWLPTFHLSVAGLPRSRIGDHHADAHIARPRIPLIGARASRDPCVVGAVVTVAVGAFTSRSELGGAARSDQWLDLAGDVPDEARELARDRHADLVVRELADGEMPVASREAQLRAPGDLAHPLRLAFLALLQGAVSRVNQDEWLASIKMRRDHAASGSCGS